jgi:hypothetical protein
MKTGLYNLHQFAYFILFFYFPISLKHISSCPPELILIFHIYVRYLQHNLIKLLSFSVLERTEVERCCVGMTLAGLSSTFLLFWVTLETLPYQGL